jgi:hypothetical protein
MMTQVQMPNRKAMNGHVDSRILVGNANNVDHISVDETLEL